ncbi:MAG: hypothetical protein PUE29_03160 [Olsenella sp.]|nr:hypothetical protein [Olsenella sp.]
MMERFAHLQGTKGSAYFAEEPLADFPCHGQVALSDNSSLARLLSEHDGYSIATGVYPSDRGIIPVPLETDEIMNVGYLVRQDAAADAIQLTAQFLIHAVKCSLSVAALTPPVPSHETSIFHVSILRRSWSRHGLLLKPACAAGGTLTMRRLSAWPEISHVAAH